MVATIEYFIKANIVISLLYGFYWLLLKDEKRFTANRIILLACIAIALLLPLVPSNIGLLNKLWTNSKLPDVAKAINGPKVILESPAAYSGNSTQAPNSSASGSITLLQVAFGVYVFVATVLLSSFVWQLLILLHLVKTNIRQLYKGISYLKHSKDLSPFSFFKHLVINESQYTDDEYLQILAHEKVHIKQWHTVDVLLSEIIARIFWINPLAYMLKRSIKLNLEYIADDAVLTAGIDKKAYQLNILNRSIVSGEYLLTNLFTSSKIKLRIKMMNTKKQGGWRWYKYAFVLPVIFAGYVVINPVNAQKSGKDDAKQVAAANEKFKFNRLYVVINANTDKERLTSIMDKLSLWGVDFKRASEHFSNGHLTDIAVQFNVPGAFNGAISSDSKNGVLAKPVIFYYEPETGFHVSTGLVPNDMTDEGKKIVTNNLNGLLIMYKGGRELSGSCRWD